MLRFEGSGQKRHPLWRKQIRAYHEGPADIEVDRIKPGQKPKNLIYKTYSDGDLFTEITRYQEIRVRMQGPEGRGRRAADLFARFALEGSIRPSIPAR